VKRGQQKRFINCKKIVFMRQAFRRKDLGCLGRKKGWGIGSDKGGRTIAGDCAMGGEPVRSSSVNHLDCNLWKGK